MNHGILLQEVAIKTTGTEAEMPTNICRVLNLAIKEWHWTLWASSTAQR